MTANWGVHLFHATWQSAIVALVAIAIARSFPRASSRFRYALLGIAMIKFALPPMLTLPLGVFSAMPPVGSSFFWPAERPFVLGSPRILSALMTIHFAGAIVTALLLIARVVRMRMLIRAAARSGDGIVTSEETATPFVYGVVRPTIVLPSTIGNEEMHDVLEHERMHVAQNDSRHAALQSALAVIWWWNPVYWLLAAELRRVREERCDDAVLAAGVTTAWRYSRSIIDVAAAATAGVPMARHPLESRLRRLADARVSRSRRLTAVQVIVLILASLVFLPGVARSGGATARHIHIHQH